nr:MAG TPA: hypothetical protein [Caudoviricetes sp.]
MCEREQQSSNKFVKAHFFCVVLRSQRYGFCCSPQNH